jgi:Flp pilus assembly protein protease CpaA
MNPIDWIVSLAALGWLTAVAVFDIRTRKVPNPFWTGIPMVLASAYRLLSGTHQWVIAAAATAVLVSERRHLKQKLLEGLILVAGFLILVWLMFTTETDAAYGIVGVIVFWMSWELKYIGGADAMVLITCLLLWPGIEFVLAYLIAGLGWSLGARIKQGGWLKSHPVPGLAVVATAAILYLIYQVYLSLKI